MILRDIPGAMAMLVVEYNYEETSDERRLEIEEELGALDLTLEEKVSGYAELIAHYEAEAAELGVEEKRIAAWRKRHERSADWLHNRLEATLLNLSIPKMQAGFHALSFRKSDALKIVDKDSVPEQYRVPIPATFSVDSVAMKKNIQIAFAESDTGKSMKLKGSPDQLFRGEFADASTPGVVLEIRQNLQIK